MKLRAVFSFCLMQLATNLSIAQNIYSLEPVQVTGSMNGFSTDSSRNSSYRRVSTTTGFPTDGRGQWVKTYQALASGGQVQTLNMPGGSSGGFLFISGPSTNRFQNKWALAMAAQAKLDTINNLTAYNSGQDIGLNLSSSGYYTFVFNDCGYSATNARFYCGFTQNPPVSLSSPGFMQLAGGSALVGVSTSAAVSSSEKVFVRYTTGTDFSGTTSSTILQLNSVNPPSNTNWNITIPSAGPQTTVRYYFFTSTLTASQLNSLTEIGKNLCCIRVLDNGGLNYSYTNVPKFTVNFRVDMRPEQCNGPIDSVTISGNTTELGNWSGFVKLNSLGNQVYGSSLQLDSGTAIQYKFRYHKNGLTNWESNLSTSSGNRELLVQKDTSFANPCFGSLIANCSSIPVPSTITFLTDLSKTKPDSFGRVYVVGNFTNPTWFAGALRMNPVGGMPGYFMRTVQNVCPQNLEFKFVNGDSSNVNNAESFPNPAQRSCTVSNGFGGFNRTYTRTSGSPVNLYYVFDSCTTALPVGLIDFKGIRDGNDVVLYWKTSWEQNNKGFWVVGENNTNEENNLGFVESKGNSHRMTSYTYSIKEEVGNFRFLLIQEDFDGSKKRVGELVLENQTNPVIEIGPNPFFDFVEIQRIKNQTIHKVSWFDTRGQKLEIPEISDGKFDTSGIEPGIYLVEIDFGSFHQTLKLLKTTK